MTAAHFDWVEIEDERDAFSGLLSSMILIDWSVL